MILFQCVESALAVNNFFLNLFGFIFIGLCFSDNLVAQVTEIEAPKSDCDVVRSLDNKQQAVYFTQLVFEANMHELAIVAQDEQQLPVFKRITYHQNQTAACHFPTIAVARAGIWGWYLAWTHEEKAYYARMDGEALVFPPPKLLPVAYVNKIEFLTDFPQPTMRIKMQNGTTQYLTSDDEGRHWKLAEKMDILREK